jgi:tetratricopeptide (TPR) repeat protein
MTDRMHSRVTAVAQYRARTTVWRGLRAIAVLLQATLLFGLAALRPALAEPIKADITVNTSGGYARIVFRFSEEIDADVRMANGILVVSFKTQVSAAVDRLSTNASGYVSAARSDPDGRAVRIALGRKVTVNSMMAAERLFIDLLPDSWAAAPPSLPQEVVEELAKRAREADKKQREQRAIARARPVPLARVRVAHQPTFSRYVFELPELMAVSAERSQDKVKLVFDGMVKFDLGSAKATLPPTIESIETASDGEAASVTFGFIGKVDIRSFREDNNYVFDVMAIDGKQNRGELIPQANGAPLAREAPEGEAAMKPPLTVPAKSAPMAPAAAVAPPSAPPPAEPTVAAPASPSEPASAPMLAAPPADQPAAAAPPPAPPERPRAETSQPGNPDGPVVVGLRRQGENLKLTFPFAAPTPAAVFRRADTLWLVFDSAAKIDLAALAKDGSHTIRAATISPSRDGQVVRIALERPRLTSFAEDGSSWTVTVGDVVLDPTRQLNIVRNMTGAARTTAIVPFDEPRTVHRLDDPEVGDTLFVVTALGPARGFLKEQDFVEFRALASTHGVVIQPLADDLTVEIAPDKVVLGRPSGLTMSAGGPLNKRTGSFRPLVLDAQLWGFDQEANFTDRQMKLFNAAAAAPDTKRTAPRLELARFYLARDMYPEAKAVLDVALGDERPSAEDTTGIVLHAVANIMLSRTDEALKDLANPLIGGQNDTQLWRGVAYSRQGKWAEAREAFRGMDAALATLPIELQRLVLRDAVRAAVEARDFATAANQLNELDQVGVPPELAPVAAVLNGKLAEALGHNEDALAAYRAAAESTNRPAAAQGRLREIVLRYQLGDLQRNDVISDLESLTAAWRGDETEIEALQILARLYTEETRYRDAFHVMRTALKAHPNSEMTRRIQDEAASSFDTLFLAGKGDAMPAIDALSLFYDFRELTPIGRRGDEMIRRMTDRLVSVDLLDQATELLQHQVDHRLQGAARAQVATRLAVIYLMNHKPDRAINTLNTTRTAELSNELRNQRLLLEARALSDTGRHEVALEIIANIDERVAIRLRSDIMWAAKRWREAAEQIELLYGDRWRDWQPLNDTERSDLLRAAVGYALAADTLGLGRFSGKYAAKMAEGADRRAFEIAIAPQSASAADFREVARAVAAADTLEGFLRDMRSRYPATGSFAPVNAAFGPGQQSRLPEHPATTGSLRSAGAAAGQIAAQVP